MTKLSCNILHIWMFYNTWDSSLLWQMVLRTILFSRLRVNWTPTLQSSYPECLRMLAVSSASDQLFGGGYKLHQIRILLTKLINTKMFDYYIFILSYSVHCHVKVLFYIHIYSIRMLLYKNARDTAVENMLQKNYKICDNDQKCRYLYTQYFRWIILCYIFCYFSRSVHNLLCSVA